MLIMSKVFWRIVAGKADIFLCFGSPFSADPVLVVPSEGLLAGSEHSPCLFALGDTRFRF